MTTKYVLIISAGLILLTLISCVRNDGGETALYGQWKLQAVTHDGEPDPSYAPDTYWRFQNNTIEMRRMLPHHDYLSTFGSYRLSSGKLLLTFPDADRPPLLDLPRECRLDVVKLKGGEMVLEHPETSTLYYFKKW